MTLYLKGSLCFEICFRGCKHIRLCSRLLSVYSYHIQQTYFEIGENMAGYAVVKCVEGCILSILKDIDNVSPVLRIDNPAFTN